MSRPGVKSQKLIDLAKFLLKFSRVERATYHEDGLRAETDADHTVMLGVMGCALAQKLRPDLDAGKVAQYCLVHDLVEGYAGDTPTIRISSGGMKSKKTREKAALNKISKQFGNELPWIVQTIKAYEKLDSPEARFVKTLDKIVPKFTHILNSGKYLSEIGMSQEEISDLYFRRQHSIDMVGYAYDQPELMVIRMELAHIVVDKTYSGKKAS